MASSLKPATLAITTFTPTAATVVTGRIKDKQAEKTSAADSKQIVATRASPKKGTHQDREQDHTDEQTGKS